MDHRHNFPSSSAPSNPPEGLRRTRSASQPVPPHQTAGSHARTLDPFDFNFLNDFAPAPSPTPVLPQSYDDPTVRALLTSALQQTPFAPPTTVQQFGLPIPPLPNMSTTQQVPNAAHAFLAVLPWLQYLQMQSQYNQVQQPQPPQSQPQHIPYNMPPPTQPPTAMPFGNDLLSFLTPNGVPEAGQSSPQSAAGKSKSPSPENPEPSEGDQVGIAEDKRKRNTAASARFRIKKKQWTLNLERTISDLSSRVQELETEAAELRRENGWLKEIVMLKSKRMSGTVPDLENAGASSSQSTSEARNASEEERPRSGEHSYTREEKGKERSPP